MPREALDYDDTSIVGGFLKKAMNGPTMSSPATFATHPAARRSIVSFVLSACIISGSVWVPLVLSRRGIIPLSIPMPVYFLAVLGPILAAVIHT